MAVIIGLIILLIGIPAAIRGFSKGQEKEDYYANRIRTLTDAQLRAELESLVAQSYKLPKVVPRNTHLGTQAYYIRKQHEVALAEYRRRGFK